MLASSQRSSNDITSAANTMEFQQAYHNDLSFVEYVRRVPFSEAIPVGDNDTLARFFDKQRGSSPSNDNDELVLYGDKSLYMFADKEDKLTITNYVLAGSSVLALLDPNVVPQDFDVFMTYEGTNWLGNIMYDKLNTRLQFVFKTWGRLDSNKRFGALLVSLFDLDCVKLFACPVRTQDGLYFDVYSTHKAKKAIETKHNVVDAYNARVGKVHTRAKKYEKRGYQATFPEPDVFVSGTGSSYRPHQKIIFDKRDTDYFLLFQHGLPFVNVGDSRKIDNLVQDTRLYTVNNHMDYSPESCRVRSKMLEDILPEYLRRGVHIAKALEKLSLSSNTLCVWWAQWRVESYSRAVFGLSLQEHTTVEKHTWIYNNFRFLCRFDKDVESSIHKFLETFFGAQVPEPEDVVVAAPHGSRRGRIPGPVSGSCAKGFLSLPDTLDFGAKQRSKNSEVVCTPSIRPAKDVREQFIQSRKGLVRLVKALFVPDFEVPRVLPGDEEVIEKLFLFPHPLMQMARVRGEVIATPLAVSCLTRQTTQLDAYASRSLYARLFNESLPQKYQLRVQQPTKVVSWMPFDTRRLGDLVWPHLEYLRSSTNVFAWLNSMYDVTDLSMLALDNGCRRPARLVFNRDTKDLLADIRSDAQHNSHLQRIRTYTHREQWKRPRRKITLRHVPESKVGSRSLEQEMLGYRVYSCLEDTTAVERTQTRQGARRAICRVSTRSNFVHVTDKHREAVRETLSSMLPSLSSMTPKNVSTRSSDFFDALTQASDAFFFNSNDVCYLALYCPTKTFRKYGVMWLALFDGQTYACVTDDVEVVTVGPPLAAYRARNKSLAYEPVLCQSQALDEIEKFDKALISVSQTQALSDIDIVFAN
jgi:hypothetical protein